MVSVLFADPKTAADLAWIEKLEAAQGLQLLAPADEQPHALAALMPQAHVLVTQSAAISAAQIAAAPHLKLIQHYGRRADAGHHATAHQAGIAVAPMPVHACIAVAELAMTPLSALRKNQVKARYASIRGADRDI